LHFFLSSFNLHIDEFNQLMMDHVQGAESMWSPLYSSPVIWENLWLIFLNYIPQLWFCKRDR
jgi:hypothetical protein